MKNYLFYVVFLCLVAWAGNQLNTQVPPSAPFPAVKADTSSVIQLQDYSATVQTKAYLHPQ